MPTHHGRFGGRLLELVVMFALIGFSAATYVGVLALLTGVMARFSHGAASGAGGKLLVAVFAGTTTVLGWIWAVVLRFYKYDPHNLRPKLPPAGDSGHDSGQGGD